MKRVYVLVLFLLVPFLTKAHFIESGTMVDMKFYNVNNTLKAPVGEGFEVVLSRTFDGGSVVLERKTDRKSFRKNRDKSRFYKTTFAVTVNFGNMEQRNEIASDIYSDNSTAMNPCMLIDAENKILYLFALSKSDERMYGMDGIIFRLDMNSGKWTRESVFNNNNMGWYAYFGGLANGNPELWHFAYSGWNMRSTRNNNGGWFNANKGIIKPEQAANQQSNHDNILVTNNIQITSADLTKGLVAYYPFDGNADDISGNNNNGEAVGLELAAGYKGQCYYFDNPKHQFGGSYNPAQYVRVSNNNTLRFTDAVTFSFWIKSKFDIGMTDDRVNRCFKGRVIFFSKSNLTGGMQLNGGSGSYMELRFNKQFSGCGDVGELRIGYSDSGEKWHHVVMVITTNYYYIYINGRDVTNMTLEFFSNTICAIHNTGGKFGLTGFNNMNFNDANAHDLYIGCIPDNKTPCPYHGYMDEFLIYNRELSLAEVTALYNGQEPDKEYLAFKRAKTASLRNSIAYLKNCTNDNYRKGIEDEIVSSKTNNVSDIAYCDENYPKLADRLEDKMFGYINSMSDCESYLKYYSASKRGFSIEDKMFGYINSVSDCETYLKYYSTNKRGTAIDDKMFGLINSVSDCEVYMKYYPSSKRMAVVDDKMYQYVNASTDINDCESYLKVFPQGKHKSSVVAQKNEIASYNAAINGGKADCNAYLKKYPQGRFASKIQAKLDYMNRPPTVAQETGRSQREPSVNENNIMDYVKSMETEEYDGDTYYYVYFKESVGMKGTLRRTSSGYWSYCSQGHHVFGIFTEFISSRPNTMSGALVNLYKRLHDPSHR